MRPERLRWIIRTALAESAAAIEVRLNSGEVVKVIFPQPVVILDPNLVEWNK